MRKKHILVVFFLFLFFCLFITGVSADLGNVNRYSGSSGSSGGYSGGYSGGSSSSAGGIGHFPIFFGSVHNGNGSGGFLQFLIIGAIIIFVVMMITKYSKAAPDTNFYRRPSAMPDTSDKTADLSAKIAQTDPNFSAEQFLTYVKETYIALQTAWMEKNLDKVQLLESEELFHQHKMQLEEFINLGRKNMMERIAINNAYLTDYSRDETSEHLKVFLSAVMRDYIIDEKSGAVIAGNKDVDTHMNYILTFTRSADAITKGDSGIKTMACPNCGAPTEITSSGKCTYCGSLITSGKYSWVMSNIQSA